MKVNRLHGVGNRERFTMAEGEVREGVQWYYVQAEGERIWEFAPENGETSESCYKRLMHEHKIHTRVWDALQDAWRDCPETRLDPDLAIEVAAKFFLDMNPDTFAHYVDHIWSENYRYDGAYDDLARRIAYGEEPEPQVHILRAGVAMCGAYPGKSPVEWPEGIAWVSVTAKSDIKEVDCSDCINVYEHSTASAGTVGG